MIESITFKTELGEIITLEEVVILFDSIKSFLIMEEFYITYIMENKNG